MHSSRVQVLQDRLHQVYGQYVLHIANQPRATRNLAMLQSMIETTQRTLQELASLEQHSEHAQLLTILEEEAQQIGALQARIGDAGIREAWLYESLESIVWRYQRFFENKPRATRSLAQLQNILAEVQSLEIEARELALGVSEQAGKQALLFEQEMEAIQEAQAQGSLDEQASHFAQIANSVFQAFQTYFMEQPILAVSAFYLDELCVELEHVASCMLFLKNQGLTHAHHVETLEHVEAQLQVFREDLNHMLQAHEAEPDIHQTLEALLQRLDGVLERVESVQTSEEAQVLCTHLDHIEKRFLELYRKFSEESLWHYVGMVSDVRRFILHT